MLYLKVAGLNPLHYGPRIQQLVHTKVLTVVQHKSENPEDTKDNCDRKDFFSELVTPTGNGIAGPRVHI